VCKPNKKDVNFETSVSPPIQMVHRLQTETPSGISNTMGARSSLFFRQAATSKSYTRRMSCGHESFKLIMLHSIKTIGTITYTANRKSQNE
jgi:hypothetical protein